MASKNLSYPSKVIHESIKRKSNNIRKLQKIKQCLGGHDLTQFTLNGNPIFNNLTEREGRQIGKCFGGAAGYRKDIVRTAELSSMEMQIDSARGFMAVIEIVAKQVHELSEKDTLLKLHHLQTAGKQAFVESILESYEKVSKVSKSCDITFADDWTATYHYVKHGSEFAPAFGKVTVENYFIELPKVIFQPTYLREVCRIDDETRRYSYITPSNYFSVIHDTATKRTISTMFVKNNYWNLYFKKLSKDYPCP